MPSRNSNQKSSGRASPRGYSSSSTLPFRRDTAIPVQTSNVPVQQKRPSLFKEMAATAGGVAVGSAIKQPDKVIVVQHQQPGMAKTFGATAAGVAVGSAVGHTVGQAITGGLSGNKESASQPAHAQQQQPPPEQMTEPTGPCAWEIKQFLQCAQSQADLSLCAGFNDAIKQCKITHGLK